MENQELFNKVYAILADIAECDINMIKPDTDLLNEIGVTSLMGLEVLVELEREFDISLDEGILIKMKTPKDIVDVLEEELAV
ncbi:acyl carrier protein [Chryseobacterium panacisoli]|uniref:Acyl carrier protein n=1 Tax=Chryseobacterium panacisoli TaxID=1807141 RepID=A0A5D8ZG13_9FLAO|nr:MULTISPECIES: acyl carrier protein [Chryseobacterium]MBP2619508.1 acyl carrier protein [Chryseobacterium jejuense]TZF93517.1 acyl carrier protein [Chryseobacterium panacisoli]BAP30987.1 acyl-carrier protein [Chryseobacterium sp. StRB126]